MRCEEEEHNKSGSFICICYHRQSHNFQGLILFLEFQVFRKVIGSVNAAKLYHLTVELNKLNYCMLFKVMLVYLSMTKQSFVFKLKEFFKFKLPNETHSDLVNISTI